MIVTEMMTRHDYGLNASLVLRMNPDESHLCNTLARTVPDFGRTALWYRLILRKGDYSTRYSPRYLGLVDTAVHQKSQHEYKTCKLASYLDKSISASAKVVA